MAYTLDEFCADSRAVLKAAPLGDALPQVADRLARLLSNPAFVAETFSDDIPPGRRVLLPPRRGRSRMMSRWR